MLGESFIFHVAFAAISCGEPPCQEEPACNPYIMICETQKLLLAITINWGSVFSWGTLEIGQRCVTGDWCSLDHCGKCSW